MNRTPTVVALAGIAVTALAAGAAAAGTPPPSSAPIDLGAVDPTNIRLDARALLGADLVVDDIPTGALSDPANGRTPPYPGQVVPGFSGVVANDDGTYWAMPDNGFGTIENSTDFLLRLYHVTPDWETAAGGSGAIVVDDFISLRDPNNVIGFPIVNEDTPERLLTGGDLDIESVQRTPDGTFWIGDEFGPFIVHFDADGVLLGAPIDPPFGMSPQSPHLGDAAPGVERSRGIEAMALSPDGTKLYPISEGALTGDEDPARRYIYEVDVATGAYTDRSWQVHTEAPANMISDAQAIDDHRLLVLERDGFQGINSAFKRLYVLDLSAPDDTGLVSKDLAVNLLWIGNPDGIGEGHPEGGLGLGPVFSFPLESVETVVILDDGRVLVASDNNYPGGNGRIPGTPDDTEMIILSAGEAPTS